MRHWLMKTEPETFGLEDLAKLPKRTTMWDGVRNYQARNMMRDAMKAGDQVFFYHSNTATPGIVGIAEVVREAYPDHTAFDPDDPHFDSASDPGRPRWYMVDVKYVRPLARLVTLAELRNYPELAGLALLRKGNRLSVMPVAQAHWDFILSREDQAPAGG